MPAIAVPGGEAKPLIPGRPAPQATPYKLPPLTLPGAQAAAPPQRSTASFTDPRIHSHAQDARVAAPANNIAGEIERRARMYGVPVPLAQAVAYQESGLRQGAVSSAGAIGVMQLEPGTAKELGVNPYNWRQNIDGGVRYLAAKYKQYGNWQQALQAYNGGDGNVGSAQTQHYAKSVAALTQQIKSGKLKMPGGDKGFYYITSPLPVMNMVTPHGARVDSSTGLGDFHNGVDLAAPEGTAVHAMIGGKVIINSSNPNGAGHYVVIQDGAGRDWYYMHLALKAPVAVGARIKAGDRIGAVGMSGLTTGPHMHLALKAPMLGVAEKVPAPKAALQFAAAQLGKPYVWGGSMPKTGFDCSGLVQWAYAQIGVKLPRVTYDQVKVGSPVKSGHYKPGDLLFFNYEGDGASHVVMYAGNGRVIAAPHTGANVEYERLSALGPVYAARRIIKTVDGPKGWADPTDIIQKATKVGWNHMARVYAPLATGGGVVSANAPVAGGGGGAGGGAGGGGTDARFSEDVTPYVTSPIDTNDVANDGLGQAGAPTNVFQSLLSSGPVSPETLALANQINAPQQTLPPAVDQGGAAPSFLPPPPTQ